MHPRAGGNRPSVSNPHDATSNTSFPAQRPLLSSVKDSHEYTEEDAVYRRFHTTRGPLDMLKGDTVQVPLIPSTRISAQVAGQPNSRTTTSVAHTLPRSRTAARVSSDQDPETMRSRIDTPQTLAHPAQRTNTPLETRSNRTPFSGPTADRNGALPPTGVTRRSSVGGIGESIMDVSPVGRTQRIKGLPSGFTGVSNQTPINPVAHDPAHLSGPFNEPGATPKTRNPSRPRHSASISGAQEPSTARSHTPRLISSAPFQNAHDLVIKHLNMVEGNQIMVRGDRSEEALRWLEKYTMPGAEFDSFQRAPPPRCHPGTRVTILSGIDDWLAGGSQEKKLLWLHGTTGVGKSAIMQTLAESLSEAGHLGASLFFSRPDGRINPLQVLPTLAYQFAVRDSSYKTHITQLMLMNPQSLNKAISEQFRTLVIEPFARQGIRGGSEAWVIILDGLDECGGNPNGRHHSDRVQCDIVRLISDFSLQYPTVPLIWIIASRPETHLKAVFLEDKVASSCWGQDIAVDSEEACRDVENFLHNQFRTICQNYPDHIHRTPWPNNKQFLKIAKASLGLFIFAEVITRFIDDPGVGNPIGQLEYVLFTISRASLAGNQENPLAALDAIYNTILSKVPPSMLQVTKQLVGSFILFEMCNAFLDCDFRQLCNLLGIARDTAITALRYLHSVLHFPNDRDIGRSHPCFYHASFRDFLEDSFRSGKYFIDRKLVETYLFQNLLHATRVQFSSKPVLPPTWPSEESEDIPGHFITHCLYEVFLGNISQDGIHISFYDIEWLLPDAQLRLFLKDLSATRLVHDAWDLVGLLLDVPWLSDEYKPEKQTLRELVRRGFFSLANLGSIEINWNAISSIT